MSELGKDPAVVAREKGYDLVVPCGMEVQIDADDRLSLKQFDEQVEVFRKNRVIVTETKRTVSPGGNTHIYATVKFYDFEQTELSAVERIAFQACLGSDLTREALSLLRVMLESKFPPTCFFELQDAPTSGSLGDDIPF